MMGFWLLITIIRHGRMWEKKVKSA